VRLPVYDHVAEDLSPAANASTVQPGAVVPRRILIADDNQDSAISLALLLNAKGHETRTAHDGVDALAIADEFRPEFVLLDIGMPRLNGYDTARQLRKKSWAQGMFLVALTGWGQQRDRQFSLDAGFDSHLVKPVDLAEIDRLLAMLGEKSAGHRAQ
jgi:DNA-binding response OmpR family regulator